MASFAALALLVFSVRLSMLRVQEFARADGGFIDSPRLRSYDIFDFALNET